MDIWGISKDKRHTVDKIRYIQHDPYVFDHDCLIIDFLGNCICID